MTDVNPVRAGDYEARGDYHRHLDPHWSYAPIYERKVAWLDALLKSIPTDARILDVGAGEGALVERYRAEGRDIQGVDVAYESPSVRKADLLSLPFEARSFDVILCLDVLEHIGLLDQPGALAEMSRVVKDGGRLVMSVPNLAHFHSRLKLLLSGGLTRTSRVERHPGDRPLREYRDLIEAAGFHVERVGGIFPTLPIAFRLVNRHPAKMGWLVGVLDTLLPFPGICFLGLIEAAKPSK